jgi:hypothetical protein
MREEYNIAAMKRRGHPLREKVARGEFKLIDPFNISEEEFKAKMDALSPDEREFISEIRELRYTENRK